MTNSPTPLVVAVGAINWDVTLFVESLPTPGQEVTVKDVARFPGGTAANVAVAAARLLEPNNVASIGALGDDAIGVGQRAILQSERITTDGITTIPDAESGQAFILVDANSQNVIASALGANALLNADHIRQPVVRNMLASARSCAITDPPLPVIEEILYITTATDCRVSWDPGVLATDRDAVWPLARRVDTLLLNEEETSILFGGFFPRAITRRLRSDGWRNRIILKQGGQGATVIDLRNGELIEVPPLPLSELGMIPISSVGAGDAFHGALAALEAQEINFPARAITRRLRSDGWRNRIILKQGGQGATVIDLRNGELIEVPPLPLSELGMIPISSVGAGDAFHGAFAALEAQGINFPDALLGATASAGINVSRPGTRDSPTSDELTRTLAAWREKGGAVRAEPL